MSRITIISDAWHPQVNGAVTTLANTVARLREFGHLVTVIEPGQFKTWPCPSYPQIPLAWTSRREMMRLIERTAADCILIAVEGPLGIAARGALLHAGLQFSTARFTKFDEYLWRRCRFPRSITLAWLDWFHRPARSVFTPTPALRDMLLGRGLAARASPPGLDTALFSHRRGRLSALLDGLPRPVLLYVGRLAVEKNIEAFLSLECEGTKVVVGDGPSEGRLRRHYPQAVFLGARDHASLAELYSASDVLVFPSLTDTFGQVIIEALACGLPVAAFPVAGPADILTEEGVGAMDCDLGAAIRRALRCDRDRCAAFARSRFCWESSTRMLLEGLVPLRG